jgi:hypothetical protein
MLYLQHPSQPVASAAHGLICAVVQAADPRARGGLATAYLDCALPAYPATCPPASLALGVDTLARALPAGSSDAPAVAMRIADRVSQLLHQHGRDAVRAHFAMPGNAQCRALSICVTRRRTAGLVRNCNQHAWQCGV